MSRILVVKLGAIGDVIMALPILHSIWKSNPNCHVDWIVGKVSAPILECVNDSRLRFFSIDEKKLFRGNLFAKIQAILGIWWKLGIRHYDRILILNADSRYAILSFPCRGARSWFRADSDFRGVIPGRHHSVEYVRLLEGTDDSRLTPPIYPEIQLPNLPSFVTAAIDALDGPVIALSPAGAKNVMREEGLRRWDPESYRAVARTLRERGCRIVLVGGPGDEWVSEMLGPECDVDFVGRLDLASFLALLKRVDLVVTHDSGPLHMADLTGTAVVGIFGPTLPEEKRPISSVARILVTSEKLTCRPCYDGRYYAICKEPLCIAGVKPYEVVDAVIELLRNNLPKS